MLFGLEILVYINKAPFKFLINQTNNFKDFEVTFKKMLLSNDMKNKNSKLK